MSEEVQKDPKQIAAEIMAKSKQKNNSSRVNVARYAFVISAGLQLLGIYLAMRQFFLPADAFIFDFIFVALYISLFFISFKYPLIAFIIGLSCYLLYLGILGYIDTSFILSGWIWKLMIITFLILGLNAARNLPKQELGSDELLDI